MTSRVNYGPISIKFFRENLFMTNFYSSIFMPVMSVKVNFGTGPYMTSRVNYGSIIIKLCREILDP